VEHDGAALGGKFDRIGKKISEDVGDAQPVDPHLRQIRLRLHLKSDVPRRGASANVLDRGHREVHGLDQLQLKCSKPIFQS
jgi:hypothetical protein